MKKKIIEFFTPRDESAKAYLALLTGIYCAIGTSVIPVFSKGGIMVTLLFTALAVLAGVFLRIAVDIMYSWTKEKK